MEENNTKSISSKISSAIKHRGVLTVIVSLVTLIISIIGALFALDARYAKTIDVEKTVQLLSRNISNIGISMVKQSLNWRKQEIEDELFALETIPIEQLSNYDRATKNRFERRLINIQQKIRDLHVNGDGIVNYGRVYTNADKYRRTFKRDLR